MIHEVGRELEAKLLAKGCPFKVVDREATKPTAWRNVVVIEETGDTYRTPRSHSRNPRRPLDCIVGAKLTIYAKSAKSGANEFEHRRVARRVADISLIALKTIRAERNSGALVVAGGRWVPVEDLAASEVVGGVAYEIAFTIERGVEDLTWAGDALEEFTITDGFVTSTTEVSRAGVEEDDGDPLTPEVACGA